MSLCIAIREGSTLPHKIKAPEIITQTLYFQLGSSGLDEQWTPHLPNTCTISYNFCRHISIIMCLSCNSFPQLWIFYKTQVIIFMKWLLHLHEKYIQWIHQKQDPRNRPLGYYWEQAKIFADDTIGLLFYITELYEILCPGNLLLSAFFTDRFGTRSVRSKWFVCHDHCSKSLVKKRIRELCNKGMELYKRL